MQQRYVLLFLISIHISFSAKCTITISLNCALARPQRESEQRPHKIGFNVPNQSKIEGWDAMLETIRGKQTTVLFLTMRHLGKIRERGIEAQVLFSSGMYLDIFPVGGGKGNALSHILERVCCCLFLL